MAKALQTKGSSVTTSPSATDVIAFWNKAGAGKWFDHDPAFDEEIRARFEPLHMAAARGEISGWAKTPQGALALVILLDQFPRNLYRGTAHAFATDPLALAVARRAVDAGQDLDVEADLRTFFYMPFEHSERLQDQDRCVALFEGVTDASDKAGFRRFAVLHRDIIRRFGRFPHRNACLGRATTAEEQAFLDGGGFHG